MHFSNKGDLRLGHPAAPWHWWALEGTGRHWWGDWCGLVGTGADVWGPLGAAQPRVCPSLRAGWAATRLPLALFWYFFPPTLSGPAGLRRPRVPNPRSPFPESLAARPRHLPPARGRRRPPATYCACTVPTAGRGWASCACAPRPPAAPRATSPAPRAGAVRRGRSRQDKMAASSVCRAGCAAGRALLRGPRPSVSHRARQRGGAVGRAGQGRRGEWEALRCGALGLPGPAGRKGHGDAGAAVPGGRRLPWKPAAFTLRGAEQGPAVRSLLRPGTGFERLRGLSPGFRPAANLRRCGASQLSGERQELPGISVKERVWPGLGAGSLRSGAVPGRGERLFGGDGGVFSLGSFTESDEEPRCCHLCPDTPEYPRDPDHHSGERSPCGFGGVQPANVYGKF